jgi:dTDP-glucose 4,6-dehydratase
VGTKNLIRLQERHRFRLVFMSSSEVYGDWDGVMHEDVMDREPIRQLNDYAMSKWVGEQQVCNSARMSGTESVRIRMFNLYGPGEYFGANRGVIARFIYQALHGLPYTVYLHHHRTSTYIDDGVAGLAAVASHFVPGAVYNLGGHEYHDIRQLSDLILNKLGMDDRLVSYVSDEQFTTRDKQVSFERARLELGYEPRIGLDEGLERTIAWARRAYAEAS